MEMERIQSEIDQAIHNTDTSNKTAESLKKEILLIENAIQEKKRQVNEWEICWEVEWKLIN